MRLAAGLLCHPRLPIGLHCEADAHAGRSDEGRHGDLDGAHAGAVVLDELAEPVSRRPAGQRATARPPGSGAAGRFACVVARGEGAETRARPRWVDLADDALDLAEPRLAERCRLEGAEPAEQLVEDDTEGIDVAARVNEAVPSSACSGLIYSAVPMSWPRPVRIVASVRRWLSALAMPKSITLGVLRPFARSTRRLEGLRSR